MISSSFALSTAYSSVGSSVTDPPTPPSVGVSFVINTSYSAPRGDQIAIVLDSTAYTPPIPQ